MSARNARRVSESLSPSSAQWIREFISEMRNWKAIPMLQVNRVEVPHFRCSEQDELI
jgi:hypothetical protein